jgi:hypothetical protein
VNNGPPAIILLLLIRETVAPTPTTCPCLLDIGGKTILERQVAPRSVEAHSVVIDTWAAHSGGPGVASTSRTRLKTPSIPWLARKLPARVSCAQLDVRFHIDIRDSRITSSDALQSTQPSLADEEMKVRAQTEAWDQRTRDGMRKTWESPTSAEAECLPRSRDFDQL